VGSGLLHCKSNGPTPTQHLTAHALGWRPVIEQPALLRHVLVAAALSARDRAVAPLNRGLDLGGKQVAEVGTGTGILALAAARAGATTVVAIDINLNAVRAVEDNARANGLNQQVRPVCANLFSAIAPRPLFDVILSSPPSFAGEPLDLADRAWHAGPNYRDIASLFDQSRERLASDGCVYVLLSSHSDLELMGRLIEQAGFHARLVAQRSLLFETIIIYELRAGERRSAAREVNTPDQR
jgi:methylase of polypeptide subunit release factors